MAFLRLALAGAVLMLAPSAVWAQAASNVDCDKCVDTDDIAKKAVEKKQLGKDSVTSNRIADGTVKAKDLADNAVEESKLDTGAVTSGKIADGAVTGDKLAADAVFGRIIVIHADPVDTIGNCDALQAALSGITDNDADNPYTILLEPGVYDCGVAPVQMKAYVDLQGSGRGVTHITGSIGANVGLIVGADNAELRHVTAENADAASAIIVILVANVTSFRITDVAAISRNTLIAEAILVNGGAAVLTDVAVEVSGVTTFSRGIRVLNESSAELVNVTVGDADGLLVPDVGLVLASFGPNLATATARNSVFRGNDSALDIDGTAVGNFVSSQVDGGTDGTGTFACVGTYDGAFAALGDDCAP